MRRYLPFDALRGLAIMGVVLIHISGMYYVTIGTPAIVFNQLSRFAVPVFLILSGWGLTITHSLRNGYGNFLARRSRKILPLYLFWTLVYFLLHIVRGSTSLSLSSVIGAFIFGNSEYHMYYVPLLFFFYITYPLFLRIGQYRSGVFLTFVITLVSMYISIFEGNLTGWVGPNVFSWMVYFTFGVWLGLNLDKVTKRLNSGKIRALLSALVILAVGLLLIEMKALRITTNLKTADLMTAMKGSVIIYSLLIVLVFMSWGVTSRFLIKLGKHAYGIYLFHPLLVIVVGKVVENRSSVFAMILEYILVMISVYYLTRMAAAIQKMIKKRLIV